MIKKEEFVLRPHLLDFSQLVLILKIGIFFTSAPRGAIKAVMFKGGPPTLMEVFALFMVKHLQDGVLSHDFLWKEQCHVRPSCHPLFVMCSCVSQILSMLVFVWAQSMPTLTYNLGFSCQQLLLQVSTQAIFKNFTMQHVDSHAENLDPHAVALGVFGFVSEHIFPHVGHGNDLIPSRILRVAKIW